MKVLVACEESQRVCIAFREFGHEAYSCDIVQCSGGHPEWHIICDCIKIINGNVEFNTQDGTYHAVDKWDLIIAHPPCTYLSNAATSRHSLKSVTLEEINARTIKRIQAQEFFMEIAKASCEKICIENPVGVMNTVYRKPDQIIEPYMFSVSEEDTENYVTKRTCLWLKGLPKLRGNGLKKPDNAKLFGRHPRGEPRCWIEMQNMKDRATVRSKTFPAIAKAMAEQWEGLTW